MDNKTKFIVFELKGDYGFFKKPETTTSPISFYFPPRVTILGIIAAILGEQKDNYHEKEEYSDENCKIAIRINKRINSVFYNTNTAEFSNSLVINRAPTKYTYLKEPSYIIYVHLKNTEKFLQLKNRLDNQDFVYNISLGLANLFARIENVKELDLIEISEKEKEDFINIRTVIPFLKGKDKLIMGGEIHFQGEILKTNMPRIMNNNREIREYCTYIYERNGNSINIKPNKKMIVYKNGKEFINTL